MRAILSVLMLGMCAPAVADDYWNQFRGPHEDGTSTETGLPVTFGEGSPEIVWKTAVLGRAWSSPVVWDKQIWVSNAPELVPHVTPEMPRLEKPLPMSAVCLDLDSGKILHDIKLFDVYTPQITWEGASYASSTPYIEAGRVYMHFGAYGTACLDTKTGATIWKRDDMPCNHFRGPGASPIVYGDLLYLTFDGYDQQYFIALNKHTGETVWKHDRDIDYQTTNGDAKKGYSTPILIEAGGRKLLISTFAMATIAYEPLAGKPIWTLRHGGMNASARPLYGNGLLYLNSSDGPNPLIAVSPDGEGDIAKNVVWRSAKAVPKRPSQLLIGDLLFMMNDAGVASCLDAKTGKEIWANRLPGEYWSSPLWAEGLIYCVSMHGEVVVFKAAREFELVAENKFDEGFIASPAVAGKSLILRSKGHVYRVEKAAQ